MLLRLADENTDLAACQAMLNDGSRSFAAAARLLPRRIRDPATALYAFCRDADDVIDRQGGRAALAQLQQRLVDVYAGRPADTPADRAFTRVVERFAIPRALPEALLEGFAWDAEGRRYATLSDLRAYAVRVAGTVGAMMAVLMGVRDSARLARAIDLGVAMQLFNIARDVGEDARTGRLYLPTAWLQEVGIDPECFLAAPRYTPALGQVIGRVLTEAEAHKQLAQQGIARLPVACRLGISAASLLYAEIGAEVARRGLDSVSGRAVVSGRRKAWVLGFGLLGSTLPVQTLHRAVIAEGAFLVDAVVQTRPREVVGASGPAWWDLPERARSFITLLERLEQRQQARG